MCGIIGYIGQRNAQETVLDSLTRLEYRGYDSAGIATLSSPQTGTSSKTHIVRAKGKLVNLKMKLQDEPSSDHIGIGHTRWATHGRPTENNAHPHQNHGITVVHNGIIENHHELKASLRSKGFEFASDTDTEIFTHLIYAQLGNAKTFVEAIRFALKEVEGTYGLAILNEDDPEHVYCAKSSSPLMIGVGEGETFVASDVIGALPYTKNFVHLHDGDIGVVSKEGHTIYDLDGTQVEREPTVINWSLHMAEKEGHKHFMIKEILEQPQVVADTLLDRLSIDGKNLDGIDLSKLDSINRIILVACGTSLHAAMMFRHTVEEFIDIPVEYDFSSEFRYRNNKIDKNTLVIGISQSGETADTVAALERAQKSGAQILAICNVVDSTIARLASKSVGILYTHAGPEISVASTKAFVTQIALLDILALNLSLHFKNSTLEKIQSQLSMLSHLPKLIEETLKQEDTIRQIAKEVSDAKCMIFLGRGPLYPIALEGALKMKEISYIHAEGYAAGEMKHGPIALIEDDMPVIVLATQNIGYDKTLGNIEEIKARGGRIILICEEGNPLLAIQKNDVIVVPKADPMLMPILASIPLQLLAYHVAVRLGTDVDQPRNLAKSVTVE